MDGDEDSASDTEDHPQEEALQEEDDSLRYIALGGVVTAQVSDSIEDYTTPRSSYSQQVDGADDAFAVRECSTPRSPAMSPCAPPSTRQRRSDSWPLPPPEQERLLDSLSRPSDDREDADAAPPQSPSHVWLAEPTSIDEPLLLLDEEEAEVQTNLALTVARLREELQEARASRKADRAEMEELAADAEEGERKRCNLLETCGRLDQENTVLRTQLQSHHGIMAAEWGQTLGFQERLRQEEAACAELAEEVRELRAGIELRAAEEAALRQDAANWRLLCRVDSLQDVKANDLDTVLEAALPGVSRINTEIHNRHRSVSTKLAQELEHRLCVVCKDREKAILFKPCLHVCVCEGCRGRLRPYRCPICQEPVREHIGRIHF